MKPMRHDEIRGTWATLLLPIDEGDRIDEPCLQDEIDALCAAHPDGMYSCGSAGEFFTLSENEFDRVNMIMAQKCEKQGVPFQIGASHMSAPISLGRIRRAAELKPSAIQVILPDWMPVNLDEGIAFLERAAEVAAGIGLVLYNPPHAKRVFEPEDFERMKAAVPALVGVKVLGGDAAWYERMRAHMRDLSVFIPGHWLATGISRGAHGAYSNIACLSPAGAVRWHAMMKSDLPRALEVEARIESFRDTYLTPYRSWASNIAFDKFLAAVGGWADIGTRVRWPYQSIPQADAEALRPIVRKALPELFSGC